MLREFQVDSEGTQPCMCMYPFSPKLPFHPGCHITLSRVPCTIQEVPIGYPYPFFFKGIKAADAKELKQIASTPSLNHVFNVANFDAIVDIQNEIISQVCSGVDEQLGELVSGEEGE